MPDKTTTDRRYESTRVHGNKWGYRGVEWDGSRHLFRARIEPTQKKRGRWLGRFATAEAAALAYDEAARIEYGADAHLNFPEVGEQSVQQTQLRLGLCAEGHDMNKHGRVNVKGHPYCKACNLAAAKRYYARRVMRLALECENAT